MKNLINIIRDNEANLILAAVIIGLFIAVAALGHTLAGPNALYFRGL